jgi:hypothetical protein
VDQAGKESYQSKQNPAKRQGAITVKLSVPPSGHSVKGPPFKLIHLSMMFRNNYLSCERIVKRPRNSDVVLSNNRVMLCAQVFSLPQQLYRVAKIGFGWNNYSRVGTKD